MVAAGPPQGAPPKKNKVCPICDGKLGFGSNKTICPFCGTTYHRECLEGKATRISGRSAMLLFPNMHDSIIYRARHDKIGRLPAGDPRLYRQEQSKVMAMPEDEVLQDYKEKLCSSCAEEVRKTALQVGKNLELAHRYEDAAAIYDDLGMFEDSGRMREILSAPKSPVERERIEREKIVERQIVKVKCRYCGALNDHVRRTCESCGANL